MTPTHSNLWFSNLSVALQVGRISCLFPLTFVFILLQWSVCRCGKTTGWLLGQNVLLAEKMQRMMSSGSKIKLFAVVRDTEKSWGLTALAWNDPNAVCFSFPPPACSWYTAPSSTRFTRTKRCVVLLCHLATCLATVPLLSKQKHVMISGCDLFLKEGIHM